MEKQPLREKRGRTGQSSRWTRRWICRETRMIKEGGACKHVHKESTSDKAISCILKPDRHFGPSPSLPPSLPPSPPGSKTATRRIPYRARACMAATPECLTKQKPMDYPFTGRACMLIAVVVALLLLGSW
ncbi:hypothetical protein Naga_100127g19 [Nannochloropsis gaditana]|uniref:Uncharacterized protein n=1 Tax=Nannochloropsis gaditana TaxID=72520 RepID=W7U2C4_9STRA|nr:hypothetical protein Naga_100127g19 [Nannochloropsis gaditana]